MITRIYADNPNPKEVNRVADLLNDGGVVVLPTDTLYAFVCSMEHRKSVERIARLKGFSTKQARYSMLCESLSQASEYIRPMDKDVFHVLKECLPGPYTFIMEAGSSVPRNYQNSNHTIGIRVPDNPICRAVIEAAGCPLIGTSVRRLDQDEERECITDPELIHENFGRLVDLVVDGGMGGDEPSTVADCTSGEVVVIREGKGRALL